MPGRGTLSTCGGVWNKLAILHDGTIVPCHNLSTLRLGVIGSDDFQKIWLEHPQMQSLRQRQEIPLSDLDGCRDCSFINFCTGGCPGLTLFLTGKLNVSIPRNCFRFLQDESLRQNRPLFGDGTYRQEFKFNATSDSQTANRCPTIEQLLRLSDRRIATWHANTAGWPPLFSRTGALAATWILNCFSLAIEEGIPLGLSQVKLTGGEPLLHPDFLKMVDLLREKGLGLTIETNGLLLTETLARYLKEKSTLRLISVSLDGACPETHDAFRGVKGSFEKACRAIRYLAEVGYRPQVIMSLHEDNVAEVETACPAGPGFGGRFGEIGNSKTYRSRGRCPKSTKNTRFPASIRTWEMGEQ